MNEVKELPCIKCDNCKEWQPVYIFEQYGYCRGCGYELDIKGGE